MLRLLNKFIIINYNVGLRLMLKKYWDGAKKLYNVTTQYYIIDRKRYTYASVDILESSLFKSDVIQTKILNLNLI